MFVILLRFSQNKARAPELMDAHNAWIKRGFEEGTFLLVGSLEPGQGGSIVAHDISPENLQALVNEDPFVQEDVVTAEILQISPKRADDRLSFLVG